MNNKYIISTLNITWGCIQTTIGYVLLFLLLPFVKRIYGYEGSIVITTRLSFGVSLGAFIFLSTQHSEITKKHEYGHCKQSAILGPLYLLAVGIISFCRASWALVMRRRLGYSYKEISDWYYGGYPENWADKLGKVERVFYKL